MKSSPFTTQGTTKKLILKQLEPGWDKDVAVDDRSLVKEVIMMGLEFGTHKQPGITSEMLAAESQQGEGEGGHETLFLVEREPDHYAVHFLYPLDVEGAGNRLDVFTNLCSTRILKTAITWGFDFNERKFYYTVRILPHNQGLQYDVRIVVFENISRVQSNFSNTFGRGAASAVNMGTGGSAAYLNEGVNVNKTKEGTVYSNVHSPRNKKPKLNHAGASFF